MKERRDRKRLSREKIHYIVTKGHIQADNF